MSVEEELLCLRNPPEKARRQLEFLREDVRRHEKLMELCGRKGLTASQLKRFTSVFREASGLHDLKNQITNLLTEMEKSNNENRKDAVKRLRSLWDGLKDLAEKRDEKIMEAYDGTGVGETHIRLMIYREAFSAFQRLYRYRDACEEWRRKEEKPCSKF